MSLRIAIPCPIGVRVWGWLVAALAALPVAAQEAAAPGDAAPQTGHAAQSLAAYKTEKPRLVIRIDDIGFSHASNLALRRLLEEGGCVTAVSVMVTTGWLDETVAILKDHPEVSVGVHVALNAEWKPYRWGPVLPASEVPSLVDEWGNLFGTRADMMAHNPNIDEVEREIRAQVDLALRKGLRLSYIDHHMNAAVQTPEMRERFERVAADYGLAISRYFGEDQKAELYRVEPSEKADFFIGEVAKLTEPGLYLAVVHPCANTPEVAVLRDLNEVGPKNMSEHRQAELDTLCDHRLRETIEANGIELVGYDTLRERFLGAMDEAGDQ